MNKLPFLAVCCGNEERGDDAAGPLVAERLRWLGIPVRVNTGDTLALLSDFDEARHVVLVDAVVTGAATGTIVRWDARHERIPAGSFTCSTHTISIADAVELARVLEQLPEECTIYGIEADHFDAGSIPSREVFDAVDETARRIWAEGCILVTKCASQFRAE